jgi:hypothetical protein
MMSSVLLVSCNRWGRFSPTPLIDPVMDASHHGMPCPSTVPPPPMVTLTESTISNQFCLVVSFTHAVMLSSTSTVPAM